MICSYFVLGVGANRQHFAKKRISQLSRRLLRWGYVGDLKAIYYENEIQLLNCLTKL